MKLSVIIITFNEEQMIADCIKSIGKLADEILVIDSESVDKTVEIAQKLGARVLVNKFKDFSSQRNFALEKATGEWIIYLDADERTTPELKDEILKYIKSPSTSSGSSAFRLRRKNFYLGNHEWPKIEKLERLFKKDKLKGWHGRLHESPMVDGEVGELDGFLLHYTHRDLSLMLKKTLEWSRIEAQLRFDAHHPKMAVWRFPKVILAAFWSSYIREGGWRVGVVGLIESLFQSFSIFITYARLWEMQNTTALHSAVVKQKTL